MSKKFTLEFVKSIFEKDGASLLATEYTNCSTKMDYRCSCGNLAKITLSHFLRGQRCERCRYIKIASKLKLDFEYVKKFFLDSNCELLEKEYKNARTSMKYRCSCNGVSFICFDSFKNGNRCKKCGNKKIAQKLLGISKPELKLSQDFLIEEFLKEGCKLLGNYESPKKQMDCICSCGNNTRLSWIAFKKGVRCNTCNIAKRSGSNHYLWRKNREQLHKDYLFRQRCYKLVRMSLNVTGRVKNKRTAELLGYDYRQLQEHITSHPNYNKVKNGKWHIDHIFPIKAFADHNIFDLSLINCLENLRPITAKQNLKKNAKYCIVDFRDWLDEKGIRYDTKCRI